MEIYCTYSFSFLSFSFKGRLIDRWRSVQHEGNAPSGTKERKEFLEGVSKEKRASDEENFDEAVGLYRRAGNKPNVRFTRVLLLLAFVWS